MLYDLFLISTARHVLQVLPIALLCGGLLLLIRRKKGLAQTSGRELLLFVFTCYCAGLLCMVLAPNGLWQSIWRWIITGVRDWRIAPLFSGEFCLEPRMFRFLSGQATAGRWTTFMYIGNIGMFIPMGFLLPAVFNRRKKWQHPLMGIGLILFIELFQPLMGRSFDTDDLICNALGLFTGLLLQLPFSRKHNN